MCQVISTSVKEKPGRRDRQSDECGHISAQSVEGVGGAVVMCGVEGGGGHDVGMGTGKEGEGIGGTVGLLMQREKKWNMLK